MARLAERVIETSELIEEPGSGPTPDLVAVPLPGKSGSVVGALVLLQPSAWVPASRRFVRAAASAIAASLEAARAVDESLAQGELVARRNIELETVRELVEKLHGISSEEELLQSALDVVLDKLGLGAGWIFWGDRTRGHLELAAARGIDRDFVRQARQSGIGTCLCQDVFATGRLRIARNTVDCPRLPDLVEGAPSTTSHACVPLNFERGTLGVMNIANRPGQALSSRELEFLETIGNQITIAVDKARSAVENARLYRETQDALVRLQEAQFGMLRAERLAALGMLSASLAHEVRNPLNSIHLQLVLLSRRAGRLEESMRAEMSSLIETAQSEIERLDNLVAEFLAMSSADRLVLEEADPAAVVRELMILMAPSATENGIRVEQELGAALPLVPMDREKIKQVLVNVLRNAIEAMPTGGTLRVSVQAADGAVVVCIADTGSGIEKGRDVFDFFMTTKRGGTGLGLPIARRIVEAHGGDISYESEPGRGTTFSIRLKAAPTIAQASVAE